LGIYEMKKPKRINSFSVTLALLVSAAVYTGYVLIPVWWPVFQETGIMQGICNDAYREFDNDKLMGKLLKESARTGLRLTKENFTFERIPYTAEETRQWTGASNLYSLRGKECILSMGYVSNFTWPGIGRQSQISWQKTVRTDLATVKW
jgi:hypothetical protein